MPSRGTDADIGARITGLMITQKGMGLELVDIEHIPNFVPVPSPFFEESLVVTRVIKAEVLVRVFNIRSPS